MRGADCMTECSGTSFVPSLCSICFKATSPEQIDRSIDLSIYVDVNVFGGTVRDVRSAMAAAVVLWTRYAHTVDTIGAARLRLRVSHASLCA